VLWSDGTVTVYGVPGDKQPLLPLPTGDSRQAIAQRRLAGFRLPVAGKQKGGASGAGAGKKRGAAAADPEAAAGCPSMAAVSDKQLALAGWATNSEGEGWRGAAAVVPLLLQPQAAGWPAALLCMPRIAAALLYRCCTLHCTPAGPGYDDSVTLVDRDS